MNQRHAAGEGCQRQHPIDGRIAAPEDDNVSILKAVLVLYQVIEVGADEVFDPRQAQRSRPKCAKTGCNDYSPGTQPSAGFSHEHERTVVLWFEFHDLLAQVIGRIEWCGLLRQAIDQLLAADTRQTWNVIDRFFWIEGGALAADFGE